MLRRSPAKKIQHILLGHFPWQPWIFRRFLNNSCSLAPSLLWSSVCLLRRANVWTESLKTSDTQSAFNYLGLGVRDTGQHYSFNKVDESPIVDMMHIKDSRLMLQPDGFTQIQSDRDLLGVAWRSSCGLLPEVFQGQIISIFRCTCHKWPRNNGPTRVFNNSQT